MRPSPVLLLATLALLAGLIASAVPGMTLRAGAPVPVRVDADHGPPLDDAVRDAALAYSSDVPADVRVWVASAIARTRPEARRLIDAVDGQVTVQVHRTDGLVAGFVQPLPGGFTLSLDESGLRSAGDEIRKHVIVHELGHVVDLALVPADMNATLDRSVPRIGGCTGDGIDAGCASAEERFADTFAKWALGDPVVLSGSVSAGYRVAPPPNLALWGEPLHGLDR